MYLATHITNVPPSQVSRLDFGGSTAVDDERSVDGPHFCRFTGVSEWCF